MSSESLNWPLWLIVVIFGIGAVASRTPLRSPRPDGAQLMSAAYSGKAQSQQRAQARLWEDPLLAGASYLKSSGASYCPPDFSAVANSHVLAVVVPGGPYAHDTEQRSRMRYAIGMAMLSSKYKPVDPDKVGVLRSSINPEQLPLVFEGWEDSKKNKVLVLWISEENLLVNSDPDLYTSLQKTLATLPGLRAVPMVSVLGPATSDGLAAISMDVSGFGKLLYDEQIVKSKENVQVLSPLATAVLDPSQSSWVDSIRTISNDDELAGALVAELRARGIFRDPPYNSVQTNYLENIVIVSESDSEYGRKFPDSFDKQARSALSLNKLSYIRRYFYLRGLDGFKGTDRDATHDEKQTPDLQIILQKILSSKASSEKPAGNAQLDYVRRLAKTIQDSQNADSPITAIGICGTDVFDKLLLLQGLREVFSGPLFFTTDLDAAILMPDQYRWARNLIVASAFDLQLRQDAQGEAPPFRDGYQTSLYFTAKNVFLAYPRKVASLDRLPLDPRTYEIGRAGARDLKLPLGGLSNDPRFPNVISPVRLPIKEPLLALMGFCILLTLMIYIRHFIFPPSSLRRSELVQLLFPVIVCIVVGLFAYLVVGYLFKKLQSSPFGEPVAFLDGISVWPSEAIRFIAGAFAVYWIFMLLKKWDRAISQVECKFSVKPTAQCSPLYCRFWTLNYWALPYWIFMWQRPAGSVNFQDLWSHFRLRTTSRARVVRTIMVWVFFFFGGILVFKGFHMPPSPIRGEFARSVDCCVLYFSVIAVTLLNFLVWDCSRLYTRFIHLLTSPDSATVYPSSMLLSLSGPFPSLVGPALLDTRIAAKLTEAVAQAIYFPLIALFLLILARSQLFDNWQMGMPLVLVLGTGFAIVLISGFGLRAAAEKCRKAELDRLKTIRENLAPPTGSTTLAFETRHALKIATIDAAIAEVSGKATGAFARFRENPILKPLLIPASGTAALVLIDYFSNRF